MRLYRLEVHTSLGPYSYSGSVYESLDFRIDDKGLLRIYKGAGNKESDTIAVYKKWIWFETLYDED